MDVLDRVVDRRRELAAYGLGGMLLLAGLSKFVILTQWVGYTPGWAVAMLPVGASTLMHAASVAEVGMGLGIVIGWKRHVWSGLAAVWLFSITVMTGMAGFYDVAIRDLGLTVFAAVVALDSR